MSNFLSCAVSHCISDLGQRAKGSKLGVLLSGFRVEHAFPKPRFSQKEDVFFKAVRLIMIHQYLVQLDGLLSESCKGLKNPTHQ